MNMTEEEKKIKRREYKRRHYREHSEQERKYKREYYKKNQEKMRLRSVVWRQKNPDYQSSYESKRIQSDLNFYLLKKLRSRVRSIISKKLRKGSAINDLGCSLDYFRNYLEKQFKNGMTWDNRKEWHIDHIKPLSSFKLTNKEDFLKACHYTNLQPLWAKDNLSKGAKII